jgi:hypothetical protein
MNKNIGKGTCICIVLANRMGEDKDSASIMGKGTGKGEGTGIKHGKSL